MIQRDNIVLHTMHPPEIPHQDRGNRSQKNTIRRHEIQEPARGRQNPPRHHHPRDERANELPAADIHVRGEQSGEIVGGGEAVGGDVDAEGGEGEGEGGEEAGGAVGPVGDEGGGVPVQGAVVGGAGGGAGDADEGDGGEGEGEEGDVEVLPLDAGLAVAGEVGHVDGEGGVVAYYLGGLFSVCRVGNFANLRERGGA